ncbi:chemotaxis protein CheB [Brasilonema octagenarum]|uniref:protein-glutamate methylesterase n=1 Tax=Brasilonema octagenarum UFV-OR1 TaxID=417115 RepID=A0ABX1MFM0_9CYAN|nr:chemotaxis protein CheB [Brasilonema octagenarum]NMF64677.1 chemotaxis protein CheB [Brasilonema octagenarum UFV-OR1]
MPGHDLIVVGASAGGVEALSYLVKNLPPDLNAAVMIVLHVPSHGTSVMPRILSRAGKLPASHAKDGEVIELRRIYVAPPNYHLLVKPGYIHLTRGATENGHRPAIDPLFRTAARAYGRRVVAVVLTGVLDDGTAGVRAVKMRNGVAVVQNPEDAMYPGMPRSAIENVDDIDYILPLSDIADILVNLANTPVEGEEDPVPEEIEFESGLVELDMNVLNNEERPGKPSTFGCPDCGGTLWDLSDGKLLRFRCRTGHAYSAETLLAKQSDALEDALWFALRALEEKASLSTRMAKRMRDRNQTLSAQRLEEQVKDSQKRAGVIRDVLLKGNPTPAQGNNTDVPPDEEPTNIS